MTSSKLTDPDPPVAGQAKERLVYLLQQSGAEYEDTGERVRSALGAIWRRRWLALLITIAFGFAGVAYALTATPWYEAAVTLLPRDSKSGTSLSSQIAKLGGLASLVGINLGANGREESIAILHSHGFARAFIENRKLETVLLAEKWEWARKVWKRDPSTQPDIRDALEIFEEDVLSIAEDRKTGLLTLTVQWTDPILAAAWANAMVEQVNEEMRNRALEDAQSNIIFLQKELQKADVVALQQAIARLLETEMQRLMLARGDEDFAFKTVDRAEPPKKPSRPNRFVIIFLALLTGGIVAIVVVIIKHILALHGGLQDEST